MTKKLQLVSFLGMEELWCGKALSRIFPVRQVLGSDKVKFFCIFVLPRMKESIKMHTTFG